MKRILALMLAVLLIVSLAACGEKKEAQTSTEAASEAEIIKSGGWTVYDYASPVELPEKVQTAFNLANANLDGVMYTPIAYLGSQVVAGTNYAVLCLAEPVVEKPEITLKVEIIYADLEGNYEVTKISDFNIEDYTQGEGKTPETLSGGWSVPETVTVSALSSDAEAAFKKALEGFTGNSLTPMAQLGSQVVAGTNYAILCNSKLVTAEPVSSIQVVTVYADLNGGAEISNICTLDIADFNK